MQQPDMLPTEQVGIHFKQLGERLGKLVNEHVELAKAELRQTVATVGRDVALTAAGAVSLAIGYLFLVIAASIALGEVVGMARGFLLVAAFHVLVGGALVVVFARRLGRQDKPGMPSTTAVLAEDNVFARRLRGALTEHRS